MGYAVRRIPGRCIGLKSKPQGAKKQLTTAVDLDALLALPGAKRKTWLEEEAATTLPPKATTALKDASSEAELLEALAPRIDRTLFDGPQPAGSLVFQPTEERRRSGSHYTPRALTRPIVEEALRPWLERCNHQPTAAQILALKICDPAMGSGAFLVECCRYLAELLELAWSREGLPEALKPDGSAHGEEPLIYARRLIAQSCLYGVDKNPFAVNLARLSLWLVSLSKDAPFTFVDHALKCGDSLVGMERSEIEAALKGASLQRELQIEYLDQVRQQEAKSFALFHADSRSDADDAQKRQALDDLNASTAYLRTVGDLLVAAFFNGKKPKDREELKQLYLAATLQHSSAAELEDELAEPLERLREGVKGIQPLHWQLAFPDVFGRPEQGFDVFVGNPPYLGGAKIWPILGDSYPDWVRTIHSNSSGKAVDLIAHFFRRSFALLGSNGALGFISTNTVFQGDTRQAGLKQILFSGGRIYSAIRRIPWKGDAVVVACAICLTKSSLNSLCRLGEQEVSGVNSFLLPTEIDQDPEPLWPNRNKCFRGADVYGMGFVFSGDCLSYEGSLAEVEQIVSESPEEARVVHDYIGGKEITQHPRMLPHRKVIDFTGLSIAQAREFASLFSIVEKRVKPERDKLGGYSVAENRREKWWLFGTPTPALNSAKKHLDMVCAISQTSKYSCFGVLSSRQVFSHKVVVVCDKNVFSAFAALSSSIHSFWCGLTGSTMKEDPVYSSVDCFETFPFPAALLESSANDLAHDTTRQNLETIGERYHQFRAELMVANNEGLTSTYNRFHDPSEYSSGLLELRRLHGEMDQAVLNAYGWSDVPIACGFGLDYLDLEEDAQLPDELQERIDSGELFFWDSDEASAFEAQVRAYGAVKGKKKFPWRYRWPDDVRDDVLARLLALNAERYAEEVALGLHGKGGKKPATDSSAGGKRVARPAKAADSVDTQQIGLAL